MDSYYSWLSLYRAVGQRGLWGGVFGIVFRMGCWGRKWSVLLCRVRLGGKAFLVRIRGSLRNLACSNRQPPPTQLRQKVSTQPSLTSCGPLAKKRAVCVACLLQSASMTAPTASISQCLWLWGGSSWCASPPSFCRWAARSRVGAHFRGVNRPELQSSSQICFDSPILGLAHFVALWIWT